VSTALVRIFLTAVLFLFSTWSVYPSGSAEEIRRGNKAYQDGDFASAEESYSKALNETSDYNLFFSRGSARYQQGKYADAVKDFQDAAVYADSEKDQSDSVFNAGTASYRLGEEAEKTDPGTALKNYETAASFFERTLEIDTDHSRAPVNLEFTRRKIQELENKISQNPQEQKNENREKGEKGEEEKSQSQQLQPEQPQSQEREKQQSQTQESQSEEPPSQEQQITPEEILRQEELKKQYRALNRTAPSREVEKNW